MDVKKNTIVTDIETGERAEFRTMTAATEYIKERSGRSTSTSTLTTAKRSGNPIYGRFLVEGETRNFNSNTWVPKVKKNHHVKKDGWLYEEFGFADSVLIASRTRCAISEEYLFNIMDKYTTKFLQFHVDRVGEKRKRAREYWYVEVYLKLPEKDFKEKVEAMERILETIGLSTCFEEEKVVY